MRKELSANFAKIHQAKYLLSTYLSILVNPSKCLAAFIASSRGAKALVHFGLVEIGRVEFSKLERLLKGMLASGNDEWCCVCLRSLDSH